MQADDGGKQLHGDGQSAKAALHTHPYQAERGPTPYRTVTFPRKHRQGEYQHAQGHGEITMNHFYPCFAQSHRSCGHGGLRGLYGFTRAKGRGMAIATRPIGTTQTRVAQAGERAKQHKIETQKQRQSGELVHTLGHILVAMAQPNPNQWPHGHDCSQQQQFENGAKVEKCDVLHKFSALLCPKTRKHAAVGPSLFAS